MCYAVLELMSIHASFVVSGVKISKCMGSHRFCLQQGQIDETL